MRVLVAGASGGTGRAVLSVLEPVEVTVRGLTRSAERTATLREAGADEVVVGDLLDPADAGRAVEGADAVVSTVGSDVRAILVADELVDGPGVVNLARAAADAGVERFALQSAVGVGDSRQRAPLAYRLPIARTLEAKGRAEDALRSMAIEHVVLRPGVLTNGPDREDEVVAEGGDTVFGLVSRATVARLLVAALATPEALGRTFEVVSDRWSWGPQRGTVEVAWAEPAALGD